VRLRRLQEEFGADLLVEWRAFLLRPRPGRPRTLEEFRAYTQSWLRPAADADAGTFRVWATDEGPPSHSVPPHLAAKAAALIGPDAFGRFHDRLLHAYFAENRDITRASTLAALWAEVGLRAEALRQADTPALQAQVLAEHDEAASIGLTGVPAVRVADTDLLVMGAQPLAAYRRWVQRLLGA